MLWRMAEAEIESRGSGIESNESPRKLGASNSQLLTLNPQLTARLARVKLFLSDVDGILTDGYVSMGGGGEYKRFNIRDGLGLRLLQHCGIKVGWISARPSDATKQRADDLKIDFLVQSMSSKVEAAMELLKTTELHWEDISYMGDDVVDLGLLKRAGVAIGVPDGVEETKTISHYVTKARGGDGAVREVVELILRAQGKWERLVEEFFA